MRRRDLKAHEVSLDAAERHDGPIIDTLASERPLTAPAIGGMKKRGWRDDSKGGRRVESERAARGSARIPLAALTATLCGGAAGATIPEVRPAYQSGAQSAVVSLASQRPHDSMHSGDDEATERRNSEHRRNEDEHHAGGGQD